MDILFCDICNESVPQADLETRKAQVRKGRVICANCEAAMSASMAAVQGAHGTPIAAGAARAQAPASGGAQASPYAWSPPPVAPSGATSVVALVLAVLAVVLFSVGAVLGMDRLATMKDEQALVARGLRNALDESADGLESEVADARRAAAEQGQALLALLEDQGEAQRLADANTRDVLDELRGQVAALDAKLAQTQGLAQRVEGADGRVEENAAALAAIRDDLGVLARRLLDIEENAAAEEVRRQEEAAAPPGWMAYVDDLEHPNQGVRWEAVTNLGDSGDPEVAPYLLPRLQDEDIFVRMVTARILGDLRARVAVPALIDALEDEESSVREAAVVSLRLITSRNFRFDPIAGESDRARRVKAWRDWWKKEGEAPASS